MGIDNITRIKSPIIKKKIVHTPISSCFVMLLAEKSPEKFPKQKEYVFVSESLALN